MVLMTKETYLINAEEFYNHITTIKSLQNYHIQQLFIHTGAQVIIICTAITLPCKILLRVIITVANQFTTEN